MLFFPLSGDLAVFSSLKEEGEEAGVTTEIRFNLNENRTVYG